MDQFQYTLAVKEVDTFKYNNQREAFIRKHYKELEGLGYSRWSSEVADDEYPKVIRIYKCCIKAMKDHKSANGLPDFITDGIRRLEENIANKLIENKSSYEDFINIFEFNDIIRLNYTYKNDLENLAIIFQQNPIPFKIEYDYKKSAIAGSINYEVSRQLDLSAILEAEEIKRKLGNKTYSILEDFLSKEYSGLKVTEKSLEQTNDLIELTKNLVTVAITINGKLTAMSE